jgi:hypothetical protein
VKHFLNRDMLAPNVSTFAVDLNIPQHFRDPSLLSGNYSTIRPKKEHWHSDIEWISAADEETFEVFQSAFDSLGIAAQAAPYLDVDKQVRLYAGFLVVRSRCSEAHFHVDWIRTNNEAFTCMIPASRNASESGLLYKKLTGETAEYRYKTGEAIAFGDNFVHSTKPCEFEEPAVLLCFEYGTDKMDRWPQIYETVGSQVTHLRQPDGQFVRARGKAVAAGW